MNQELLHLIEQISREKGVEKSVVIDAVLSAVLSAARKRFGTVDNINTRLDEVTGAITLFSLKTVRDEDDIVDDSLEISLEEAQDIDLDATVGSVIEVQHANGILSKVVNFVESMYVADLLDYQIELW